MTNTTDPWATVNENPPTLRLYFPQWQGASVEAVRQFFSEVPFEQARRGYAVGAAVLDAVLPAHSGPTALVPVESGDLGLSKQDGIEAKEAVIAQLAAALEVIGRHSPGRILTLGGDCSVSVAPFSWLAERYGEELAVLWIDSHPDVGTPASTRRLKSFCSLSGQRFTLVGPLERLGHGSVILVQGRGNNAGV
jgi:arginase